VPTGRGMAGGKKRRDSYSTGVPELKSGDVGILAPGLLARLVGDAVQPHILSVYPMSSRRKRDTLARRTESMPRRKSVRYWRSSAR
jgi:hypothetical protein